MAGTNWLGGWERSWSEGVDQLVGKEQPDGPVGREKPKSKGVGQFVRKGQSGRGCLSGKTLEPVGLETLTANQMYLHVSRFS